MDSSEMLAALAQQFEDDVWACPGSALRPSEETFRAQCRGSGVRLGDVLDEQSDEALAVSIQKDFFRKLAFVALLHDRYEEKLIRWFVGFGTKGDQAFDLAQEIYLRLYRSGLKGYDPERVFEAYLFAIARNLWIEKVCRKRKQPQVTCCLGDVPARDTTTVETAELEAAIEQALDRLPASYREMLGWSIQGDEPAEIARRLGIPIKTVYAQLFKARKKMAEQLGVPWPCSGRGRPRKEPRPNVSDPPAGD
jgi:RNA polymerase sigma-70 factor (ECF subfamily)